jgi:dTDP-4-dehydrorhamnose 3,5-epimerase-like enzyme
MRLPDGVTLDRLTSHRDSRGSFTEIFRDDWNIGVVPLQPRERARSSSSARTR